MRYAELEYLSDGEFKRLCGVSRNTFRGMVEVLRPGGRCPSSVGAAHEKPRCSRSLGSGVTGASARNDRELSTDQG
jgi:hypothetical protein